MSNNDNVEWLLNVTEFEGVLRCTNPLPDWDDGAALRAFQTYEWDDATTPGNDVAFRHPDGVIVRHAGELLAIELGDADLSSGLLDLIPVLFQLGWRRAELFHEPAESISALLGQIGRAIPAGYDFDVIAAPETRAISGFAESDSLIELGRSVLGVGAKDDVSETLLREMESMSRALAPERAPIVLLDDDEDDDSPVIAMAAVVSADQQNTQSSVPARANYGGFGPQEDAPQTFSLPGISPQVQHNAGLVSTPYTEVPHVEAGDLAVPDSGPHSGNDVDLAAAVIEAESLRDELASANLRLMEYDALSQRDAEGLQAVPSTAQAVIALSQKTVFRQVDFGSVVKVGASAFCFDVPGEVLTDAEEGVVSDYTDSNVVHLYPGQADSGWRWDVLGETTCDTPWVAEKLVDALHFGTVNTTAVTALVLALRQDNSRGDLRDLLALSAPGISPAHILPDEWSKYLPVSGLKRVQEAVCAKLSALALCPHGQAFVDVADSAPENVFSVRGALLSSVPRLYVVHVDSLDGPFVVWLVGLLRTVAGWYSQTKLHEVPLSEPVPDQRAEDAVKDAAVLDGLSETVSGLMAQIEKLRAKA